MTFLELDLQAFLASPQLPWLRSSGLGRKHNLNALIAHGECQKNTGMHLVLGKYCHSESIYIGEITQRLRKPRAAYRAMSVGVARDQDKIHCSVSSPRFNLHRTKYVFFRVRVLSKAIQSCESQSTSKGRIYSTKLPGSLIVKNILWQHAKTTASQLTFAIEFVKTWTNLGRRK